MALKILLDTNICIYLINGRHASVRKKFLQYHLGEAGISTVTLAELEFGIAKSGRPQENVSLLNQFVASLVVLPFDTEAARRYGQLRSELERKGPPRGFMDLLIAAQARAADAILVTNDHKAFKRIPGVKVEFWT